jgi:H+/Cl- antiporter ClcA
VAAVSEPAPATDPATLLRSREYRVLLVLASIVGLVVSTASWLFLEGVHELQVAVYRDLPSDLGYDSAPVWWPLPWVALAGLLTAFAIDRLPGRGGHVPADGLHTGGPLVQPNELPGILLAAVATLGLGLVLGPEGPLIAVGVGLGGLAMRLVRRDAPQQAIGLMAAAGSFAAVSSIFGSPIIGAVLIIEAMGLGGPTLPLVLLPGLLSAGIGSLVFIGLGSFSGFSTAAWALGPFPLPSFGGPGWGDFFWTIVLAAATAVIVFALVAAARVVKTLVERQIYVLSVAAGLVVGGLAVIYAEVTDEPTTAVLFSGQEAFGTLFASAAGLSLGTLGLLVVAKGLAWSVSLGAFRGGPTFPAIFLGVVAGLMAAHLPHYAETQAIAALVGAACVSILRLPLSSAMIATLLSAKAGLAVAPLIVVAVAVAYLVTAGLSAVAGQRAAAATDTPEPAAAPSG